MANWHALTGTSDGNSFRIVFHLPIPSALNRANVNYRTAVVNSGQGGKTALPDGDGTGGTISAAEKASIVAGALYEHVEDFPTSPGETATALQARIDARFTALSDTTTGRVGQLAKELTYFGYIH
jgi:hypothetical protein